MGSVRRRLEKLEQRQGIAAPEISAALAGVLRMGEREEARKRGEDPPPYTQEELEELRQQDMETVGQSGTVAKYRESVGWQDPESQQFLDEWEACARERLARAAELGDEWALVYQEEEED